MIIGEFGKFVWLTYLGVALALLGIYFFLMGKASNGMMCLVASGICDLFDGRVANLTQRTSEQKAYGREIDSLSDMVSFATLPSIIIMTQSSKQLLGLLVAIIYCLACITRLAYFNLLERNVDAQKEYFIGLPVTYVALVFPVVYLMCHWFNPTLFTDLVLVIPLGLALFYVINLKIPKPNRAAYLFFIGLAIIVLVSLWRHSS